MFLNGLKLSNQAFPVTLERMPQLLIFEDTGYQNLLPLTATRPSFLLRMGFGTVASRIQSLFAEPPSYFYCRTNLHHVVQASFPDSTLNHVPKGGAVLLLNGRVWPDKDLVHRLMLLDTTKPSLLVSDGQVVALLLQDADLLDRAEQFLNRMASATEWIQAFRHMSIVQEVENVHWINHLWDVIALNPMALATSFDSWQDKGLIKGKLGSSVSITQESQVYVGQQSVIEDFVYIDSQSGPVCIGDHVYIQSHTRLQGPLYIGDHTHVLGGKLSRSSIGPWCKVAGEITDTIFAGYANKAHEGFIGHSYMGEWVNLGASTTVSNLKNTYGDISILTPEMQGSTGQMFLGAILGDHVKTGIGTRLNTGTVVGTGASIWGSSVHPKWIPYFAFGQGPDYDRYNLQKFLDVCDKVLARRNQVLSTQDHHILQSLWADSLDKNPIC